MRGQPHEERLRDEQDYSHQHYGLVLTPLFNQDSLQVGNREGFDLTDGANGCAFALHQPAGYNANSTDVQAPTHPATTFCYYHPEISVPRDLCFESNVGNVILKAQQAITEHRVRHS